MRFLPCYVYHLTNYYIIILKDRLARLEAALANKRGMSYNTLPDYIICMPKLGSWFFTHKAKYLLDDGDNELLKTISNLQSTIEAANEAVNSERKKVTNSFAFSSFFLFWLFSCLESVEACYLPFAGWNAGIREGEAQISCETSHSGSGRGWSQIGECVW